MEKFNVQLETENVIKWIKDWFDENGKNAKAVIGISGGKDSSIVAALLVKALGKDRVVGVLMPNGIQKDIGDSKRVVEFLDIKSYTVNIENAYNGIIDEISKDFDVLPSATAENVPPRLRMTTLYAIAQALPEGGRVANTCNKSEDYVGYQTKGGDQIGDYAPLAEYTVTEVLAIGDYLNLPYDLVHKTPSDGLCGKSDEDKLGFTYACLDEYIRTGTCPDVESKEKIDRLHKMNLHKLLPMPKYERK